MNFSRRRDPRWVLAGLSIVGAFTHQALMWVVSGSVAVELPQWEVGLVSSIVAYYYGARNGKNPHPSEYVPGDPRALALQQQEE